MNADRRDKIIVYRYKVISTVVDIAYKFTFLRCL